MLASAFLVFFMHTGFSMLEAGSVRLKNAQGILSKNLTVVTVGSLSWYMMGYALALGEADHPNKFLGAAGFAMSGLWGNQSLLRTWFLCHSCHDRQWRHGRAHLREGFCHPLHSHDRVRVSCRGVLGMERHGLPELHE